jgi:hypothetical protein
MKRKHDTYHKNNVITNIAFATICACTSNGQYFNTAFHSKQVSKKRFVFVFLLFFLYVINSAIKKGKIKLNILVKYC